MKAYEGVELQLHTLLILVLDTSDTYCIEWVMQEPVRTIWRSKKGLSLPAIKPQFPACPGCSPVTVLTSYPKLCLTTNMTTIFQQPVK